jgi:hypothetical protein
MTRFPVALAETVVANRDNGRCRRARFRTFQTSFAAGHSVSTEPATMAEAISQSFLFIFQINT